MLYRLILLDRFLHAKITIFDKNDIPMDPDRALENVLFWKIYEKGKVCLGCTGVYGLHMRPYRGMLSATQNRRRELTHFSNTLFPPNM